MGVAEGECMTYSIGFRVNRRGPNWPTSFCCGWQKTRKMPLATRFCTAIRASRCSRVCPAAIPARLHEFARDALQARIE
jgi:hypothetical protein